VTESDYLINLTNMKGHTMAGVTIIAKNLYGSVFIPTASPEIWTEDNYTWGFGPNNVTDSAGVPDPHRGLHMAATVHEFYDGNIGALPARDYATYNYLVDLMSHPQIKNKTILYVVDGFYAGDQQNRISTWQIFRGKYSSSIFLSQDPVALESVCLDFMRSEPSNSLHVHGNVDNWLHESALADAPPSGMEYNPGAEDTPLESLGVHEHWNSWADKQYSRNLGTGEGIELFQVDHTVGVDTYHMSEMAGDLKPNYPNPFSTQTTIPFSLEFETEVKLAIYDQLGRRVETLIDGIYPAGDHQAVWVADAYPAGIYFCRMRSQDGKVISIELQKTK
jgi:hypothetical protein